MQIIHLPTFDPREYQRELLRAFFYERKKKLYLMLHRRAGKDLSCWNLIIGAACERVGLYLYLLPQTNQARKVIWKGIDGDGKRFMDYMPAGLISRVNNIDMSIDTINGSIIQLVGSNNYNALMGSNPVGIVYSEYALQDPRARQHLSPILAENGGWEIINTTPRGKNHAYHVYQQALASPNEWFVQRMGVDQTRRKDGSPVITEEDIDRERRGGMAEELIRQEFYCDFSIGLVGAYYTKELDAAEKEGRIGHLTVDPRIPVYTFWDIGVHDATAIWWMQPKDGYLHMINYYEATDQGIEHFIEKVNDVARAMGIKYHTHFAPHDMANREWGGNARSRLNIAISKGITFSVIPAKAIEDGIQAVRSIFPRVKFDLNNCRGGIDALREYRRKYDEINRVFMTAPLHNWASNCFVGETEILTRHGTCQIMNLPYSGEVMTLCGWKPYRNPRVTRKNAPLVEVVFVGGHTVRCTPDHMFLTESGWKSAESLTRGIKIQSSLMFSPNTSKEVFIEFGQNKNTFVRAADFFIGMFGRQRLEKFLTTVTFITKMKTSKIMHWIISNAWMPKNIFHCLGIRSQKLQMVTSPLIVEKKPMNGISLKKAGCGIEDKRLDVKRGRSGSASQNHANGVAQYLMPLSEKMDLAANSAQTTAKPLIIESVKKMQHQSDVWCLTVPGVEHFTLSNGAVVHNCADSFRYFAIKWSDLFTRPDTGPIRYEMPGF